MATRKKRKVTPCKKCKGHTVPARRVKSVARNSKGRFTRATR